MGINLQQRSNEFDLPADLAGGTFEKKVRLRSFYSPPAMECTTGAVI
jgi:hypothetical protein